jgi:hypothetical protein
VVDRTQCIVGTQDALHEGRQLRHPSKPLDVFPGQCRIKERGDVSGQPRAGKAFRKFVGLK